MREGILGHWHYIGHYGELGPLTREQILELIDGSVIGRETYVWNSGMSDWTPAGQVAELADAFRMTDTGMAPPPHPSMRPPAPTSHPIMPSSYESRPFDNTPAFSYNQLGTGIASDRKRLIGGVLQLVLPGVGRMYLGYLAYGMLQLVLTVVTCGVLSLWSFIDGIIILSGGLRIDGYGRRLED